MAIIAGDAASEAPKPTPTAVASNGPVADAAPPSTPLRIAADPPVKAAVAAPVLYALFFVIVSTLVTLVFRRANLVAEQKIRHGLL